MIVPIEVLWVVLGIVVAVVVYFIYTATTRPQAAAKRLEAPIDSGLQWLIDQKWTGAQVDAFLKSVQDINLTAAGGAIGTAAQTLAAAKIAQAEALIAEAKALANPPPPPPA